MSGVDYSNDWNDAMELIKEEQLQANKENNSTAYSPPLRILADLPPEMIDSDADAVANTEMEVSGVNGGFSFGQQQFHTERVSHNGSELQNPCVVNHSNASLFQGNVATQVLPGTPDLGSDIGFERDIAYTLEALFADTGAASIQHHSEEAGMVYPAQTEDQAPDMIAAPEMLTKGVDGKLRHNARAMQAHEISSASAGVSKQADTDQAHEISDASADVSDQADADLDSDKVRLGFATVFRNSRRQKSVKTFQLRAYVVPEQILKKNMMTALIKDTAVLTVVNYRESHSRWVEAKGTFSSGKDTHKKTFGRNEAYAYSFEEQLPFVASWNTSP
eukprot:m.274654 g.274654  ORF g.274654 m.274654 type:complete len:333 (+) comp40587_c0_seq13:724-1722(+)